MKGDGQWKANLWLKGLAKFLSIGSPPKAQEKENIQLTA